MGNRKWWSRLTACTALRSRFPIYYSPPSPVPDLPPRRAAPAAALEILAVRKVFVHDPLGVVAQICHPQRIVGFHYDQQALFVGGRLGVGLQGVLGAVG